MEIKLGYADFSYRYKNFEELVEGISADTKLKAETIKDMKAETFMALVESVLKRHIITMGNRSKLG